MTYYLKLISKAFEKVISGEKTVAVILQNFKYRIKSGDQIIFSQFDKPYRKICASVDSKQYFSSFADLFENESMRECGYEADDIRWNEWVPYGWNQSYRLDDVVHMAAIRFSIDRENVQSEDEIPFFTFANNGTPPNSIELIASKLDEIISVPNSFEGNAVTHIGKGVFRNGKTINQVLLPDSLECIRSFAFENCRNLSDISIPDTVSSIGRYAFCGCWSLKSVNLPKALSEIRTGTFAGCRELEMIELPGNISRIGLAAFCGCKKLKKIVIPKSVTSIASDAFRDCPALQEVFVPEELKDSLTNVHSRLNPTNNVVNSMPTDILKDFYQSKGINLYYSEADLIFDNHTKLIFY